MATTLNPNGILAANSVQTRRINSANASNENLAFGGAPAVVVPPERMHEQGDAHEIAAAMEIARQKLEGLARFDSREEPPQTRITGKYAFAFDIDGVLIKGGKPIPEAIEAMKMLNGQNNHGIKVLVDVFPCAMRSC